MDVIKKIVFVVLFIPTLVFGQKKQYPKDTIYIYFDNAKYLKKELNHPKLGKSISFGKTGVFYNYKTKIDTLNIKHLKEYKFSNLKEIRKKEITWVDRKYANSKYKPYTGSKNAVFQTYVIEAISKEKFVIYPVIWAGEGIID